MEAAIGFGVESRDVIFCKKDGSRPPTLREFAPATIDEEELLTQPSVEPVDPPTPLPAVTNAPHHCRVQRLRPRQILEPYPLQLRHPIHHSLFDHLDAIWIALGRNPKLTAQIQLPTANQVKTANHHNTDLLTTQLSSHTTPCGWCARASRATMEVVMTTASSTRGWDGGEMPFLDHPPVVFAVGLPGGIPLSSLSKWRRTMLMDGRRKWTRKW